MEQAPKDRRCSQRSDGQSGDFSQRDACQMESSPGLGDAGEESPAFAVRAREFRRAETILAELTFVSLGQILRRLSGGCLLIQ